MQLFKQTNSSSRQKMPLSISFIENFDLIFVLKQKNISS